MKKNKILIFLLVISTIPSVIEVLKIYLIIEPNLPKFFQLFLFCFRVYIMFGILNELHSVFISSELTKWLGFSDKFTCIISNIIKLTKIIIKIF